MEKILIAPMEMLGESKMACRCPLSRVARIASWVLQIAVAAILAQTLLFKSVAIVWLRRAPLLQWLRANNVSV